MLSVVVVAIGSRSDMLVHAFAAKVARLSNTSHTVIPALSRDPFRSRMSG
jgi:hypothetical protein